MFLLSNACRYSAAIATKQQKKIKGNQKQKKWQADLYVLLLTLDFISKNQLSLNLPWNTAAMTSVEKRGRSNFHGNMNNQSL